MIKWDGHTHTPYCKHGHSATLDRYVQRALDLGFTRYSITEHPPLPDHWLRNQTVQATLAMPSAELPQYISEAQRVKQAFVGKIDVRVGLELDYLPGSEDFTLALLDLYDEEIEDAILSVHFLPGVDGMRCIDLSPEDIRAGLLPYYGTMDRLVEVYFDHVERSLAFARQMPMGKRLGHLTLIDKFQSMLPEYDREQSFCRMRVLLPQMAAAGVGLDVNVAGLSSSTCGEVYPPLEIVREAMDAGVTCVYGSDAHRTEAVGRHWDAVEGF